MPVFVARVLRPFTFRAASSRPSVVRMPSDFSLEAANDGKPSISEIGYVMILDVKNGGSSECMGPRVPENVWPHSGMPNLSPPQQKRLRAPFFNLPLSPTTPTTT